MWNQNLIFFLICTLSFVSLQGQDSINIASDLDSKYLEDQFYAGVAYNVLLDRPNDVIQRNLSYNIQLGFIKDIPINSKRNFGFGFGAGYSSNSYYSNMIAEKNSSVVNYRLPVGADSLKRTKLETHAIEFPLEIRWRSSNPVDYKFWRIYAGVKAEYLFSRKSKFVAENKKDNLSFQNDDVSRWQYGLTLNFGYNTWNVHLYYSLNPLLENTAALNGEVINMRPLRLGVIFYIL